MTTPGQGHENSPGSLAQGADNKEILQLKHKISSLENENKQLKSNIVVKDQSPSLGLQKCQTSVTNQDRDWMSSLNH